MCCHNQGVVDLSFRVVEEGDFNPGNELDEEVVFHHNCIFTLLLIHADDTLPRLLFL